MEIMESWFQVPLEILFARLVLGQRKNMEAYVSDQLPFFHPLTLNTYNTSPVIFILHSGRDSQGGDALQLHVPPWSLLYTLLWVPSIPQRFKSL